jgi:hypothetical protein
LHVPLTRDHLSVISRITEQGAESGMGRQSTATRRSKPSWRRVLPSGSGWNRCQAMRRT